MIKIYRLNSMIRDIASIYLPTKKKSCKSRESRTRFSNLWYQLYSWASPGVRTLYQSYNVTQFLYSRKAFITIQINQKIIDYRSNRCRPLEAVCSRCTNLGRPIVINFRRSKQALGRSRCIFFPAQVPNYVSALRLEIRPGNRANRVFLVTKCY